jgi:hypothetical protein
MMARKEKRFEYNEIPTLLWLLAASVLSASSAIVGFVMEDEAFRLGFFALSIALLCIVFAVFVVAIIAPYISELLLNSNFNKKISSIETESDKFGHDVIVRDSESFKE